MSTSIAGDPALFPADFTIPDDGEPRNASSVGIGFEALADRTAYLKALADANKCVPVVAEYLANGTVTIPANALPWVLYEGCGGGGAGGKGGYSCQAGNASAGGGGGGGAVKRVGLCPVVPGESYSVTIGAGGVGVDGLFGAGSPGEDTFLTRILTATKVAVCRGASGGQFGGGIGGLAASPTNIVYGGHQVARGGKPVRVTVGSVLLDQFCEPSVFPTMHANYTPQAGGLGVPACWPHPVADLEDGGAQGTAGMPGNDSPEGFSGGAAGTVGTNLYTGTGIDWYYGGGAGGGGGAGPWGNGGAGGNGTAGVSSGASSAPTAGANAAANSGAGGGGGGGAGGSPTAATSPGTATHGADPGNGGSGRFRIIYFVPAIHP